MILTPEELIVLTGKRRPKAQAAVLDSLHIPKRARPDGTLIVLRIHVEYNDKREREPKLRIPA